MSKLSFLRVGTLWLKIKPSVYNMNPPFGNLASLPLLRGCMQSQLHLVFTHMVSHAIAPSHHHRERKIWQYPSFQKKYSSAITNFQSKINATFLWRSGSSGGALLAMYVCSLFPHSGSLHLEILRTTFHRD